LGIIEAGSLLSSAKTAVIVARWSAMRSGCAAPDVNFVVA
jgi:hypothetical protein